VRLWLVWMLSAASGLCACGRVRQVTPCATLRNKPLYEEGVARGFFQPQQDDPRKPLVVVIGIHDVLFFIDRDNPNLSKWVAIIEESRREQSTVCFTWDVGNQRLTALELKK
jgi:hypothetical protein